MTPITPITRITLITPITPIYSYTPTLRHQPPLPHNKKNARPEGQAFVIGYRIVLLQLVRSTVLVVQLRVSLLVIHELLDSGIPLQRTIQLVTDVTDVTQST